MKFKTFIIFSALALASAHQAFALNDLKSLQQWDAENARLTREGNLFTISLDLDFAELDVPSQEALLFSPVLYHGNDSIQLPPVGVYGRNRYFHYLRSGSTMLAGPGETVFRNIEKPERMDYTQVVEYQPWMNGASLKVKCASYGCCFHILGRNEKRIGRFLEPDFKINPKYVYLAGEESVEGELCGEAWVQFVVDRWELHQDKFGNGPELAKILHSIDTVKNDPDLSVTQIYLKGFASPEATWEHNTMLAKNRTQAVRDYVNARYNFDPSIIVADYYPEDWEGLREWVESSALSNREGILAIIDEPVTNPQKGWDEKEEKLKKTYPEDYKLLLNTVYPPLRHTEYRIKYKVRKFIDKEEIRRVLKVQPSKLSINDFNIAADGYEPGSPEFNEVYEIMVRIHPNSEIANLNAANAALQSGQNAIAEQFLSKAGDGIEAEYSRGLLKILNKEYAEALPFVRTAAENGIEGAEVLLQQLEEYLLYLNVSNDDKNN